MRREFLAFGVALGMTSSAMAQTAEQSAAVQQAVSVGIRLYEHDQAAWHSTDAMLADLPVPVRATIHGWVTEETDQGIRVSFLTDGQPRVIYQTLYQNAALVSKGQVDLPLTELQERLNTARLLAIHSSYTPCSANYNSVTLPRATPGPDGSDVDVYLMPGTSDPTAAMFGGFYRVAVDTRAGLVRDVHAFTNSCIALSMQTSREGERATALMISQIIGDTPTEVHVFQSLTVRLPVFVATRSGTWEVAGAGVHFVRGPPAQH